MSAPRIDAKLAAKLRGASAEAEDLRNAIAVITMESVGYGFTGLALFILGLILTVIGLLCWILYSEPAAGGAGGTGSGWIAMIVSGAFVAFGGLVVMGIASPMWANRKLNIGE